MDAVMVKGLRYQYQPGARLVLNSISFNVKKGEFVVITGLSGCGKSSLCLCISGANRHQQDSVMSGEVFLYGKNIGGMRGAELALQVGIVFQDPDTQLFSPTVEDEIAFAPENLCLPPERIRERIDYVMDTLGITALRQANPYRLSGGEKHLVALAAVLALDPPILILDEVMSQLDTAGKRTVAVVLKKLNAMGKTIIAVEHNLEELIFADRLMVLADGQVVRYDRMEEMMSDPSFLRVQQLVDDY